MDLHQQLTDNLAETNQRIADAARRAGRDPADVLLCVVSKYFNAEHPVTPALIELGCKTLGESRPQQMLDKWARLVDDRVLHDVKQVDWHMIGQLQRNKVRKILPHVAMIHSVDSERLISAIDRIAVEESLESPPQLLLEVNVSGETAKGGFEPDDLVAFVEESIEKYPHVAIRGLMCMAGLHSDTDAVRREFALLRQLRGRIQPLVGDSIRLDHLSMGMSGDFEIAIEEGATIVRVGSSLFRGIQ